MDEKQIQLKLEQGSASAVLLTPASPRNTAVILAHGAGGTMKQPFMSFFHQGIAAAGYACLKFNFLYSEKRRRYPDPQPLLLACYREALKQLPDRPLVIGGKSMGGRMASYIASEPSVAGLFFLGYPLHAPGKTDQLRDTHLYDIRKPMFFASGTKDPFARLDLLEQTLKRIGPFATAHLVENGGHSFEVPKKSGFSGHQILDRVLQDLVKWLEDIEIQPQD